MKRFKLIVETNSQNYPIIIGSNLVNNLNIILKNNSLELKKCLLVIDKNVPKKFIFKIKKSLKNKNKFFYFFKASEKNKNQKTSNNILKILLDKNFSRQDYLISVGGGITGDISGFAASLFKRGLNFINIPTTLLSQVDSSVGGKTGVNTKHGKNLIGSFYQPKIVIADTDFLKTLPKREVLCGYGEILKHSIIANKKFYDFLNKNFLKILNLKSSIIDKTIFESCKIKKNIIKRDEKEKSLRKVLNFGHTFGHAFEATLNYSNKLNHGEAVLLGMNTAVKFSYKINLLRKKDYYSITKHIKSSNLPNDLKSYFGIKHLNKILAFMMNDKKNSSEKINLILIKKIGKPIINEVFNKNKLKSFLKKELIN